MKNREVYVRDPVGFELLNNGVSKVAEIGLDEDQLKTLRFELETFVCEGEYALGLERILSAYLDGLAKPEQQAVWVSGFFGSGKSHLVKMLRYLWVDYRFPDGASARSLVQLPAGVRDLLIELTNRSRAYGGLVAAAGTLGAGDMDNVRLAFLQVVLRAFGLPERLAPARLVLWLQERGLYDQVAGQLTGQGLDPLREIRNFYVSSPLAEAILAADPTHGTPENLRAALRSQFPMQDSPTVEETLNVLRQAFGATDRLPCALLVVDEVQQYVGTSVQRAMDVQEIAEHCCRDLDSRLLLVATGQSALTATPNLARLQARFTVKVSLSDADVEAVIRQTVLAKKPERIPDIQSVVEANQGEISRHLHATRLASRPEDRTWYAADYPLLPVRRRFWERVLRNVDVSGTTSQLRTQLRIVFDAARATAESPLGSVVPADYLYDQLASDLLNTGILPREYHETIVGLRDGTPAGTLRSRLCSVVFLISRLAREGSTDDQVRATPENLADLLVEDLAQDGPRLRQEIPSCLEELVSLGKLMLVDDEYLLQTREGAAWTHEYNRLWTQILADEGRLNATREDLLRTGVEQALKSLTLVQGASRQPRGLEIAVTATRPSPAGQRLVLWLQHGWAAQQKSVEEEARAAGSDSPFLFGFLPRVRHEELREALAARLAAADTLQFKGTPGTDEGLQAHNAISTRGQRAEERVQQCLRQVLSEAKVYLAGGSEVPGLELLDRVRDAAASALDRLFPSFTEADHANWSQALNKARAGDLGALAAVGYQGETVRHPVCKQVFATIGAGKKGKDVRDALRAAPFGWPQDAVDAALTMLDLAGNVRTMLNGQPAHARTLTQTQLSGAVFQQDEPPLTATQRLDLKALFLKAEVTTANGGEALAAATFLTRMLELAASAGGESPAPAAPDGQLLSDLQALSGNAQLLALHRERQVLAESIKAWSQTRDAIAARLPAWERLQELHRLAEGLPAASEVEGSILALVQSCGLLADPDPVAPLTAKLVDGLRSALNAVQAQLDAALEHERTKLQTSPVWQQLSEAQQQELEAGCSLQPPAKVKVANPEEVLATLRENSLENRQTLVEALPQRFRRVLAEATRLLEPKVRPVVLPRATIRDSDELEAWLGEVRALVEAQLGEGPVML